jgi:hypothetical protein
VGYLGCGQVSSWFAYCCVKWLVLKGRLVEGLNGRKFPLLARHPDALMKVGLGFQVYDTFALIWCLQGLLVGSHATRVVSKVGLLHHLWFRNHVPAAGSAVRCAVEGLSPCSG